MEINNVMTYTVNSKVNVENSSMAEQHDETKSLAEAALSRAFGGAVSLDTGASVAGRDYVIRFTVLDGPGALPPQIIVKRARDWGGAYDPTSTDPRNPAWGLLDDWASLQFLNEVAADDGLAPRFLAGDAEAGLLAIEDLGSGDRPDQVLLGSDAAEAERALVELAATLGRLHARTTGKQPVFERIRAALGPPRPPERDPYATLGQALRATIDVLGIAAPAGLDDEMRTLAQALQHPGSFGAFTHGDPCPDNWLRVNGTLRLLDFERARYRHALLDGVYGRIHFPTCWCVNRSPAHLPPRMEQAYRAALQQGCPEAVDDTLFGRAVVVGCAYWAVTMCEWIVGRPAWYLPPAPMEHDESWGIATVRQRALLRSDILARTTEEFGYLEAIGATFAALAAHLRTVWPPDADAMPLYPAFRTA
jgi:hypothetical protein